MRIAKASLDDPAVRDLIGFHQRDMEAISPPGTSFALDVSGLSGDETTILGAWEGGKLVAIGALRRLGEDHAELKSMRTRPSHLGKGYGKAILEGLVDRSLDEGITRISLETGTSNKFAPAIKLYTRYGFVRGEPFAQYANGPHNQCYHPALTR